MLSAFHQMGSFKSSGFDCFHIYFNKKYWDVICDEVFFFLNNMFITQEFNSKIGKTLIVVILKIILPLLRTLGLSTSAM